MNLEDYPLLLRADLVLYDRHGQLAAVAEIKNKLGTSRQWAALLRRNILAHGGFRSVNFFLLVTPDRLYLWKEVGEESIPVEPTYEVDAHPLLEPYFTNAGIDPTNISGRAFELVVAAWLADLIRSEGSFDNLPGEDSWLVESGFLAAVKNGRIEYEVPA
ncbi:MAG: hypothetical protein HY650_14415 [Acidobacteria bacterium]|nr:hypothetical protein [Acidobacteriota bacterium]